MAYIVIIPCLNWVSRADMSYSIVKLRTFLPDSRYYQAKGGLSTININKNKALKTFTGQQ